MKTKQISWSVSKSDYALITLVVERAMKLAARHGMPLDLKKLLAFPDFDFSHDVFGIARHIDRETGEIGGCFVPRCSAS